MLIVDIFIPNIAKKCYNLGKEALDEMERFLLIGVTQDIKSALEYVGDDIVMKDFVEEIDKRSNDKDLREAYDKEWALKDQAFRDGHRDGLEHGMSKKTTEIALKLLNEKIPVETISKVTGLSIDEIKNLK